MNLAGGGQAAEHRIRCQPTVRTSGGKQRLEFEINGAPKAATLQIEGLTRPLVANLPDWSLDLLEIAALVYGIDSAVSRGGLTLRQMGRDWYRRFEVEMPVRCIDLWGQADVSRLLEETLMALSDDRFVFNFIPYADETIRAPWFQFGEESGWRADRVILFSGGLDSLSGALEEIVERGRRVALVSHFSSTKIAKVQRDLVRDMHMLLGDEAFRHLRVQIQLEKGTNQEGTHRTRSFLFAVLGLVTATAFGLNEVSFHENGVVSLNLPPVGNVLSTRATRTTHPRTLALFTNLFSRVAPGPIRVDNPSFWHTKTEIVERIRRLRGADLIGISASCADTHNRTRQHPHCGRCSQCIDRRVAALAAGLDLYDPIEAYARDVMTGPGPDVRDQEMALSYVRNAVFFETSTPEEVLRQFPAVLQGVGRLGEPADTTLKRITDLLNRHGRSVTSVMRTALEKRSISSWPEGSLPRLLGEMQGSAALALAGVPLATVAEDVPRRIMLAFDDKRRALNVADRFEIARNATFDLLRALADLSLKAAGQGLPPEDYPVVAAEKLASGLRIASGEGLRRRVSRSRTELSKQFASAGLDAELGYALIENIPWHGYRLRPDLVEVRIKSARQ